MTTIVHSVKRKRITLKPVILEELEERIFSLLLDIVYREKKKTVLRVAGGWVRDKLLGISGNSPDIDIALDDMNGREFAELVSLHLQRQSEKESESNELKHFSNMAIIQKNPDKSKHLETARLQVYNTWLDLVNLRTERYSENSRVPHIEIGTPKEDAIRRDLTINSLFYNINDKLVEDFTGKGITDLETGVIRTPMAPLETFLDDPLRSLRAFRFAGKFGFDVDQRLIDACRTSEVRAALATKVSRERVGQEVDKMVTCPKPLLPTKLLVDTNLFQAVLQPPDTSEILPPVVDLTERASECYESAAQFSALASEHKLTLSKEVFRIGFFAALLMPYMRHKIMRLEKKGSPVSEFAPYVMRECLKLSAKDSEEVGHIHACIQELRKLVQEPYDRLKLGLFVRTAKTSLTASVLVAAIGHSFVDIPKIFRDISSMGLQNAHELKPLLNGREVMQLLPKLPRGPLMKPIMEKQIEWQLIDCNLTAEGCRLRLKDEYSQYT